MTNTPKQPQSRFLSLTPRQLQEALHSLEEEVAAIETRLKAVEGDRKESERIPDEFISDPTPHEKRLLSWWLVGVTTVWLLVDLARLWRLR